MKNAKTYILEPEDYKTTFKLKTVMASHFIPERGIMLTKDGADTWIRTPFNVDDGCRLKLTWNGKGAGRVKHLTSTPRRRYYMTLLWATWILWIAAWILTIIEIGCFGNYATGDSRTNYILTTAMTVWMGLDIVALRNGRGIQKMIITIFSYMVFAVSIGNFIRYLISLISGY